MSKNPSNITGSDPQHVAIVMDGNGRWATQRRLPRAAGHRAGVENVKRILEATQSLGIRFLTLFAFSSENWSRPSDEVTLLMDMLTHFLQEQSHELVEKQIRLRVVGDISPLPAPVQDEIQKAIEATAGFPDHNLTLALNYGSRQEVIAAVRACMEAAVKGREDPAALDWARFSSFLFTSELPDPDLVIRTSGEYRLSNFLLLQSAYSEFVFSPVCWPDFDGEHLIDAVQTYRKRERRFGKTGEQLQKSPVAPLLQP